MHRLVLLVVTALTALTATACTSSGGASGAPKTGAGWFQARPLVMPGQPAGTAHPDPFGSLDVPATEAAYDALSRARKADLAAALRAVDCTHPPHLSKGGVRVVCDAQRDVFLLGAPLFTGNDVARARAIGPSNGVVGWQVALSLTPTAAAKVHRWSSRHHVLSRTGAFNDIQTSRRPPCAFSTFTQCSAFTAYVSRNVVVTIPVWFAPVRSHIAISGEFSQAYATGLARRLA